MADASCYPTSPENHRFVAKRLLELGLNFKGPKIGRAVRGSREAWAPVAETRCNADPADRGREYVEGCRHVRVITCSHLVL